ncbi:hypothetical protein FOA52_007010 [Chlamydomonas sp. UWO 241]|nr:hypothetical protein FOA52_007010 [Chlamydomonas sp. UWO 241]
MSHSEPATTGAGAAGSRKRVPKATQPTSATSVEPLFPSTPEWTAAVAKYNDVVKAEDPNSYELFRFLGEQGCGMLKGLGLSKQERAWLRRCTTVTRASVDYVEDNDVEDFAAAARIWAVDGSGFVDVMHEFNHKERCGRHSAKVSFNINGSNAKKQQLTNDWREETQFTLEKSHVDAIRTTLFPLAPHAALSDKINDYRMMSWILATVGYDEGNCGIGGMDIRHCQDGTVGALLRRLCGAATEKDLTWVPIDWDVKIAEAEAEEKEWWRKRRQEEKDRRRGDRDDDGEDESGDEGEDSG